jgi:hypothetical protein
MTDQIEVSRPLIEPIYSQTDPNQPINLGRVAIQVDHQGTAYRETADVTMNFVPDAGLEFAVTFERENPSLAAGLFHAGCALKLMLPDRHVTVDAVCVRAGAGGAVVTPTRLPVNVAPPSAAISAATFHLFNFPEFWAPDDYTLTWDEPGLSHSKRCDRVVLRADGWNVTVAATDRTDEMTKRLESQGGYVITHMGRITRDDESTFSSGQLDDLLTCLHYFLSFVSGRWAGVAIPIGIDRDGNRAFEQWGMRWTAAGPWNGLSSWFDKFNGEALALVFPGFRSLWNDALWREPLASALYWYLGASDPGVGIGVDTGLILAQTALELLAWNHCVRDRKMVSPNAFKRGGLPAADKLRLLASSLDIPKEIPSALPALLGRPGKKWEDGMHAITGIRNSLVHPGSQAELRDPCYEAYKLSLWYLDLTLLHLCAHNGNYANRLVPGRAVGTVARVPWAENE